MRMRSRGLQDTHQDPLAESAPLRPTDRANGPPVLGVAVGGRSTAGPGNDPERRSNDRGVYAEGDVNGAVISVHIGGDLNGAIAVGARALEARASPQAPAEAPGRGEGVPAPCRWQAPSGDEFVKEESSNYSVFCVVVQF